MNSIRKRYAVGVNDIAHSVQVDIIKSYLKFADSETHLENILDCPCGSGRFSNLFQQFHLTCGDIADHRLMMSKKNIANDDVSFVKCDLFKLPFEDNSFDFILCAFVLQHINKNLIKDVLLELRRVTNSWILLTYNKPAPLRIHRGFKNPRNAISRSEFANTAASCGLDIKKSRTPIPYVSANRFVLLRKRQLN